MNNESYNGWRNYETWNVALWIGNDERLYRLALAVRNHNNPYSSFVEQLGTVRITHTMDHVAYTCRELDMDELNSMIRSLP